MTVRHGHEALKAFDDREHLALEEDPVVVAGVRRGLADLKAGRSQSLEDFDAKFRAKYGIDRC